MTNTHTKNLLLAHYREYPSAQIEDIFKFLHQSTFGCGHMVSDEGRALEYINEEMESVASSPENQIEELDGEFCRVHLSCLDNGMRAETLARLFYLSSKREIQTLDALKDKLCAVRELVAEKSLPFSLDGFDTALNRWKSEGYCARHHSDAFRQAYSPAYRVISKRYVKYIPLFERIDTIGAEKAIVAIEGGRASGQSTLSEILGEVYDCAAFHMDDFFLQLEQRTPERYAEIGGNIDRERFLSEVVTPLREGRDVEYRRFDCCEMKIQESVVIKPKRLNIVEGAYSLHPYFEKYYDLAVFLDVDEQTQRRRIEKRNSPAMAKRFFSEWIPMEKRYFSGEGIKDRCDVVIEINE